MSTISALWSRFRHRHSAHLSRFLRTRPTPRPVDPQVKDRFDVTIIKGHGWSGATRLWEGLIDIGSRLFPNVVAQIVLRSLDGNPTDDLELNCIAPGSIHVLVVRANYHGTAIAVDVANAFPLDEILMIVAVEDGHMGPRVPLSARSNLRSLRSRFPIIYLPFVSQWRWGPGQQPSRSYVRAIHKVVYQLVELEALRRIEAAHQSEIHSTHDHFDSLEETA